MTHRCSTARVPVFAAAVLALGCAGHGEPTTAEPTRAEPVPEPPAGEEAPAAEQRLDAALRAHGDFGAYGDLSEGLAWVEAHFRVTVTEAEGRLHVDLGPLTDAGHDFSFIVAENGTIEGLSVGQVEPPPDELDETPSDPPVDRELACEQDTDCVAAQTPQCCRCCPCSGFRAYSLEFLEWLRGQCAMEQCPPREPGECDGAACAECPADTSDRPAGATCQSGRCALAD